MVTPGDLGVGAVSLPQAVARRTSVSSTAQLLIVSPDKILLQAAYGCLSNAGHNPLLARDLRQARWTLTRAQVDLVCLDCVLPPSKLERFWQWLCADPDRCTSSVIFLAPPSARLVPAALPAFFEAQRHGLVTKPLESSELTHEVARVLANGARLRRQRFLQIGDVALDDVSQRLLFEGGGALALTGTEFRLMRYLMERPGEFVSTAELLDQVWGYPPGTSGPEVVRSHVSNLRRKLRAIDQDPRLLRTMPYRGYGLGTEERAAG